MPRTDARVAPLGAVFAVNGALYGSLLPRYPQIADQVGASAGQFGLALAGIGLGGVTGAFVATRAVRALGGPRRALLVAGPAFLLAGLAVAAAPSLVWLTVAFAALGLFDGFVDTAMNQAGVTLRQRTGVSVMGRLHAALAAATLVATAAGAAVAGAVGTRAHLLVVVGVLLVVLVVALRALPASPPRQVRATAVPSRDRTRHTPSSAIRRARWWVVVAAAGLAAVLIELPAQEWSGLLLARELGAGASVAGAGPLVAVAGVLAGRLVLDRAVDAAGWAAVAKASGALAVVGTIAGLVLGAVTRQPAVLLAGLGVAAVGAGAAVPLLFDRAAPLAVRVGLAPEAGAGLVSGVFRLGVLVSPLLVGAIAAGAGLFVALGVTAVAGVMIAALAGPITRDHPH